MLVGNLVHQTINQVLLDLRKGQPVPVTTAIENTVGKFRQNLTESERGDWQHRPSKSTNLFEHYYGETPSGQDLVRTEERLAILLESFYGSPILDQLRSLPGSGWVTQETLDSFTLEGQKVWVSLDLAVRERDMMYIYDWKTGRERVADKVQLAVYALFATKKLNASLLELTLRDFYLESGKVVSVEMDSETVDKTTSLIGSSIEAMLESLDDPIANKASRDRFPLTDRTETCRQCPFKSVCFPPESQETVSEPSQQLTLSFS
jgi:CRISPR/Cas system-associated exonuclease Cas4 (RecB family)